MFSVKSLALMVIFGRWYRYLCKNVNVIERGEIQLVTVDLGT